LFSDLKFRKLLGFSYTALRPQKYKTLENFINCCVQIIISDNKIPNSFIQFALKV
jgi:hypothetical protein